MQSRDIDEIIVLGKWLVEKSLFKPAGFSSRAVRNILQRILCDDMLIFGRSIVNSDGVLAGIYVGDISSFWFSEAKFARDMVILFREDMRDGCSVPLKQIFLEFEAWAKESGAVFVVLGAATGVEGAGFKSLLLHCGYDEIGFWTQKRI